MEPLNPNLANTLRKRWWDMSEDEQRAAVSWLIGFSPTAVVRAMNYAERLAEEVDETIRLS